MSSFADDIIAQFKRLGERIRNLELSVYAYGKQPEAPPVSLAVGSLTGTPSFYVEPVSLLHRGAIQWTWQAPNSQDDPISHYMVSVTRSTDATTGAFNNVGNVTSLVTSGHALNTNVTFRIYAVTQRGVNGPTSPVTVVVSKPVTTPPQPATPTWEAGIKSVYITNNGKTSTGADMPSDVTHYEVYKLDNGAASFTPGTSNYYARMSLRDTIVIPANDTYQNIAVRLIAVNSAGNKGAASTGVVATPKKVLDSDSGITLPTGAAYSDVNNLIIDGSNESASIRALRNAPANFTSTNDLGGAKHGTWFWKSNNAVNPGTHRALFITGSSPVDNSPITAVQVSPNTKLFLGFHVRNIGVNAGGAVSVFCRTTNIDPVTGQLSYGYPGITVSAEDVSSGDWEQRQAIITTSDYTSHITVYFSVRDTCTSGEWHFDAFELRQVLSTVLIEDGAITRAKIGDAAIGTAQIEEIDAGVIKSGIIDANRIGANSIQTRHLLVGAITPAVVSDDLGAALDIQGNPALSDMASKTIVDGIATDLTSLNSSVTNLTNAVKIDAAGVTISDVSNTSNPASVVLNAEGLNLYEGTARVAYINGQVMYIRSAEITNQLKIGVHIIEKYDANNTFIRWVG